MTQALSFDCVPSPAEPVRDVTDARAATWRVLAGALLGDAARIPSALVAPRDMCDTHHKLLHGDTLPWSSSRESRLFAPFTTLRALVEPVWLDGRWAAPDMDPIWVRYELPAMWVRLRANDPPVSATLEDGLILPGWYRMPSSRLDVRYQFSRRQSRWVTYLSDCSNIVLSLAAPAAMREPTHDLLMLTNVYTPGNLCLGSTSLSDMADRPGLSWASMPGVMPPYVARDLVASLIVARPATDLIYSISNVCDIIRERADGCWPLVEWADYLLSHDDDDHVVSGFYLFQRHCLDALGVDSDVLDPSPSPPGADVTAVLDALWGVVLGICPATDLMAAVNVVNHSTPPASHADTSTTGTTGTGTIADTGIGVTAAEAADVAVRLCTLVDHVWHDALAGSRLLTPNQPVDVGNNILLSLVDVDGARLTLRLTGAEGASCVLAGDVPGALDMDAAAGQLFRLLGIRGTPLDDVVFDSSAYELDGDLVREGVCAIRPRG